MIISATAAMREWLCGFVPVPMAASYYERLGGRLGALIGLVLTGII